MNLTKEELERGYHADVLDKKGLRRLIHILLHPELGELQEQLKEILAEGKEVICKRLNCEVREKKKGHGIQCKMKDCRGRLDSEN